MLKALFSFMPVLIFVSFIVSCGGDSHSNQQIEPQSKADNAPSTNQAATPPAQDAASANASDDFVFSASDLNGSMVKSSEWVGKQPVVINFWGTWCPPCRKEIPDLVRLYNEYNIKGIEILGVALNDKAENVVSFSQAHSMNWKMLVGDVNVAVKYGISGIPTTIFLDRNGKEVERFVGPRDYDTFKKAFESILKS